MLEYEYLVGKALLQESEEVLRGYMGEEGIALLRRAGFRGSERGDELDYSRIPPEKARELDQRLYELFKERKIGLYHYRESLLRIRAGEHLEMGYRAWDKEIRELERQAKERLSQVERYAETSRCRVKAILRFLGETLENCAACDACTRDSGPWEEQESLETEELERAYHPMDTLLAYFALAEKNAWSQEARYRYLGRRSTLMALRGKDRSRSGALGRKYTDNRFFGHLSFIRPRELERAFEEALKKEYLEVKDAYEAHQLYGLTEKGRRRYERWQRREVGDVGA
jgi:ATP-dependent DNA helicase RecQ